MTINTHILSTDVGNAVPLIINVEPVTQKTSVDLQEIGNFGAPWYMNEESIKSDDNFISYSDGIISEDCTLITLKEVIFVEILL